MIVNAVLVFEFRFLGEQGFVSLALSIGALWPVLAVTVKRLHDRGRSAWSLLAVLIPVLGQIWLLVEVWMRPGLQGVNRFGDVPLDNGLDRRWIVPLQVVSVVAQVALIVWAYSMSQAASLPTLIVDLGEVRRGSLVVTVDDDGETRVQNGDPEDIAIVVEYLSTDAVEIEPGQRVIIDDWGGAEPFEGRVRSVDPLAFTRISALGTEERRVNVVIDFIGDGGWEQLGPGYPVTTRIVVGEADDLLLVPLAALLLSGDEWEVFVDVNGSAERRVVTIEYRNSAVAGIRTGVEAGERVVAYPVSGLIDGALIKSRD